MFIHQIAMILTILMFDTGKVDDIMRKTLKEAFVMTEQLLEIAERLRTLREIMEISEEEMAQSCAVSIEEYREYEKGNKDFSFSFIYNAANKLQVDVVDLMSGDSPKLSRCCLVKAGKGYKINRRAAYDYQHLAFTFRNKKAEPFLVTVEPKENERPVLHAHEGQELNYMTKGRMMFYLDDISYELEEGDSIYFDSGIPHAMRALDNKPAQFLAVVIQ